MNHRITTAGPRLLALLCAALPAAAGAQSNAASNQLLKLDQWDWKQAIAAPREGFLQRQAVQGNTSASQLPATDPTLQKAVAEERRQEQQLYEKQRRERVATGQAGPPGTSIPAAQRARRQGQVQTQRFRAEADSLRLQQDIQRRAMDR